MPEANGKLISELKVHELRTELINRGLDGTGVKAILVSRLEKSLNEQGIDINSYLFMAASEPAFTTATSMGTENNDGATSAKNEAGKTKAEQEAVTATSSEENVPKDGVTVAESSNGSFTDQKESINHSEADKTDIDAAVDTNKEEDDNINEEESPDIGDLEERAEDSEADESKIDDSVGDADVLTEDRQLAVHDISDEENYDYDEEMLDSTQEEAVLNEKPVDAEAGPTETPVEKKLEEAKPEEKPAPPAKSSRIPAGLNFPKDDPHGLQCIWIRGIPAETRPSELKMTFMDAGFNVKTSKIFTTKNNSRASAFGFMTLGSDEDAKNAVTKMNNSIFRGKIISVERACDVSMLQNDLVPNDRPKTHPPIKPPEDAKINTRPSGGSKPKPRGYDNSRARPVERRATRGRRSPYMNTVNRARIIRAGPQRVVESSGHHIRVVPSRDSTRSMRRRTPIRAPIESDDRYHRHHHRSPDRVAEERRKYEELMRRKEEEHKQRERELKLEAERNRARLEKERLEKENLALKLKLQEQMRTSSSRRSSPPRSSSTRHRSPPPPPARRASPSRASRQAAPRHHSASRRSPYDSRNQPTPYRSEQPKAAYPARRRTRSRSPMAPRFDRPVGREPRYDDSRSRERPHDNSRRLPRVESPIRSPPRPAAKYDRSHSPRRNYETRDDRSRRNEKPYPADDSRNTRSGRSLDNRDYSGPSSNFDRHGGSGGSFNPSRREPYSASSNANPSSFNSFGGPTLDYQNPSYSTTSSSRNPLPNASAWPPQQSYATTNQQSQPWPQPQSAIPGLNQWNASSFNNPPRGNQRYNY